MTAMQGDVTQLLAEIRRGNKTAEARLIPLVYSELRRLAAYYLKGERPGHTLQPTALVHEAYLRLVKLKQVDWQGRSHFFAISANLMRRILVDHARAQQAKKRYAKRDALNLDDATIVSSSRSAELIALDEALDRLSTLDPRQGKVVELRFFGGMSEEETSDLLGAT